MYESHFHLSGKPFQLNPDPDFFFGSRGHKRAMAYLEYGLHQGEGFIVITGEVGAGKTTLVRNLLRRMPRSSVVPVQIVSTQLDADDMLRVVAGSFGIQTPGLGKSDLLLRLEQHLLALHRDGKRALLVIDEAQNLTPRAVEELRMLSNFQVDTRSLLQSFLVGQPEFREIMQRPEMRQLKQRIIASYHLGPLDRAETQLYIEHRLRHVGWKHDPAFEDGAFDRIFAFTEGMPRRINTLCDRLMLGAFLSERHAVSGNDVDEAAREIVDELGFSPRQRNQQDEPAHRVDVLRGGRMPSAGHTETGSAIRALAATLGAQGASIGGGLTELDDDLQALLAEAGRDGPLSERVARLEDRMAVVEASANLMFGLLRRTVGLLQGGGMPTGGLRPDAEAETAGDGVQSASASEPESAQRADDLPVLPAADVVPINRQAV